METNQVIPTFNVHAKIVCLPETLESNQLLNFQIGKQEFLKLWSAVVERACSRELQISTNDTSVVGIGSKLKTAFYDAIGSKNAAASPQLKKYMIGVFTTYWVAKNCDYFSDSKITAEQQWIENAPKNALRAGRANAKPLVQCCGYALLTRDLAEHIGSDLGLKCNYVWGWFRHQEKQPVAREFGDHGWVMMDIGNGVKLPSDPTTLYYQMKWGKRAFNFESAGVWVLPFTPSQSEYFYGSRWGIPLNKDRRRAYDVNINLDQTDQFTKVDPTTSLSWQEWRNKPIDQLRKLEVPLDQRW